MLGEIKTKFYEYLRSLNYNVSDNGTYRGELPWLLLRTGDAKVLKSRDLDMTQAQLVIDIFSAYNGEKEILEVLDAINDGLKTFIAANDIIQFANMRSLRIIDDPETGPVRKHGVATFTFVLAKEEDDNGE